MLNFTKWHFLTNSKGTYFSLSICHVVTELDDLLIKAYEEWDFHQFNNTLLKGADPNIRIDGVPLVFLLIQEGHFEQLDALLSFDVSLSVRHNSLTVLHELMLCRIFDIDTLFESILEKGKLFMYFISHLWVTLTVCERWYNTKFA